MIPSIAAARSCQSCTSVLRWAQKAYPMMAAATTPTATNIIMGPQLRSLPTRTGATGLRPLRPPRGLVLPLEVRPDGPEGWPRRPLVVASVVVMAPRSVGVGVGERSRAAPASARGHHQVIKVYLDTMTR